MGANTVATRTNSAGSGLVGLVAVVAFIVVIAATPLYVRLLQSDQHRLAYDVRDDVEQIRRLVLHIDENLSSMRQLAGLNGASKDAAASDEILKNPKLLDPVQADSTPPRWP